MARLFRIVGAAGGTVWQIVTNWGLVVAIATGAGAAAWAWLTQQPAVWIALAGLIGFVAVVWLIFGVRSLLEQSRAGFSKAETRLELLFHGNPREPTPLKVQNIFRWYALVHVFIPTFVRVETGQTEKGVPHVTRIVFLVFDKPVNPSFLHIKSQIPNLPTYEVKDFSPRSAVVFFHEDIPAGTVEFSVARE